MGAPQSQVCSVRYMSGFNKLILTSQTFKCKNMYNISISISISITNNTLKALNYQIESCLVAKSILFKNFD